jgi:hypothetical protein
MGQKTNKQRVGNHRLGKGGQVQEGDCLQSDVLVRQQAEVTGGEHAVSEGTHEGVSLQSEDSEAFHQSASNQQGK